MASPKSHQESGSDPYDVSSSNVARLEVELREFLPAERIVTDPDACYERSNNEWAHIERGKQPAIVITPLSTAEVSRALKACNTLRIPVTSCSGRTSTTGAIWSTRGGLCVDFQLMNSILQIHEDDLDAVVQPGVDWRDLRDRLAPMGLFFPPDPGPGACIGGMINTSCGGTNAYRWGTIKDWIVSLTVVLADGKVLRTKGRAKKCSNGYDLTHLIIGSEGTLGLVTEAVIRLAPSPINQHVAVAVFPDSSAAVQTGLAISKSGLIVDALELLDGNAMRAINKSGLSQRRWTEKPTLFIKLSGPLSSIPELLQTVEGLASQFGKLEFEASGEASRRDMLWEARKLVAVAFYQTRRDPEAEHLVTDSTVPVSRVVDLMDATDRLIEDAAVPSAYAVHLGDGNVHCIVLASPEKLEFCRELLHRIGTEAVKMEGTISGEHGIGFKHRDHLVDELGEDTISTMRTIKLALDPSGILNPDKIFRLRDR